MIPSVDKTVHYLDAICKGHHVMEFAGVIYETSPKEEFRIRPSTFFKDTCLSCGQCCRNWDTVFFPSDLAELEKRASRGQESYQEYLDIMTEDTILVDGEEKIYYSAPPMYKNDGHDIWVTGHTVRNCRWIFMQDDKKLCKIHEYRCITCGFPHMELYMNIAKTHGFLGHKQFGRNNQLGCKVDIKKEPMDQGTLDSNIYWLSRLEVVADYFGVSTYLPEVLDYLRNLNLDDLPDMDVIFKPTRTKKLFNLRGESNV